MRVALLVGTGATAAVVLALWRSRSRRRHPCGLSARAARALAAHRGGRLHVFDTLRAGATALLVVDMQEAFLSEANRGKAFFAPRGRAIVPAVNRVAAALRSRGGRVVWVTSDVGPDSLASWSVLYDRFLPSALRPSLEQQLSADGGRWGPDYDPRSCAHGMDGPLDPDLDIRPEDCIVKKDRFSVFAPGGGRHQGCRPSDGPIGPRDFAAELRQMGITSLLLAGVTTACCVEATARDAMHLNFEVVVLSDACAASTLQDHTASLDHLAYLMADVRTVDQAVAILT